MNPFELSLILLASIAVIALITIANRLGHQEKIQQLKRSLERERETNEYWTELHIDLKAIRENSAAARQYGKILTDKFLPEVSKDTIKREIFESINEAASNDLYR